MAIKFDDKRLVWGCVIMFAFVVSLGMSGTSHARMGVCVKESGTCSYDTPPNYSPTWAVTCGGVTVRGLAFAGSEERTSTGSFGQVSHPFRAFPDAQLVTCYCRVFHPFVWNSWVPVYEYGDTYVQAQSVDKVCAQKCVAAYVKSVANGSAAGIAKSIR